MAERKETYCSTCKQLIYVEYICQIDHPEGECCDPITGCFSGEQHYCDCMVKDILAEEKCMKEHGCESCDYNHYQGPCPKLS